MKLAFRRETILNPTEVIQRLGDLYDEKAQLRCDALSAWKATHFDIFGAFWEKRITYERDPSYWDGRKSLPKEEIDLLNKAGSMAIGFFLSACTLFTIQIFCVYELILSGVRLLKTNLEIKSLETKYPDLKDLVIPPVFQSLDDF